MECLAYWFICIYSFFCRCDEKFAGAITKDMNIFADSCTTVGGKVSVEKQELLQNETSLLSMHFILRVKLKLTSDEIPDLSNSNLLKENSLLSNLWLSPGEVNSKQNY